MYNRAINTNNAFLGFFNAGSSHLKRNTMQNLLLEGLTSYQLTGCRTAGFPYSPNTIVDLSK